MTQINSYLTFGGNCREAMNFYKDSLGGELTLQTIGESPLADKMPAQIKDCILHAILTKGNLVLMGSDMVSDKGFIKGNAVSMAINCSSDEEIKPFMKNFRKAATGIMHWKKPFGVQPLATLQINRAITGCLIMKKNVNDEIVVLPNLKQGL